MKAKDRQYRRLVKEAHAHGIALQRSLIIWLGIAGMVILLTGVIMADQSPVFNQIDRAIFIIGCLIYGGCSTLSYFIDDGHLYEVVRIWILSAMLLVIALVTNGLFGSNNSTALSAYSLPYLLVIPPVIVFCHTYLDNATANRLSVMFSAVLTALFLSFLVVYADQLVDPGNSIFLVSCLLVLMPITIGMMNIHHRKQDLARKRLEELLAQSVHQERLQQRAEQTDPPTQLLNVRGLSDMMQEQIEDQPDAYFQTLSLQPVEAEALSASPPEQRELLLARMVHKLRDALHEDALLARTGEWRFFALARRPGVVWDRQQLDRLLLRLSEVQRTDGSALCWQLGAAITDHQTEVAFALEEADFQRYMAETRELPLVISPVLHQHLKLAETPPGLAAATPS